MMCDEIDGNPKEVETVQSLYYSSKFQECIEFCESYFRSHSQEECLHVTHKEILLFQGLSYMEIIEFANANACFDHIVQINKGDCLIKSPAGSADSIDLKTIILSTWKIFTLNVMEYSSRLPILLDTCMNYKNKHENSFAYNETLFTFGTQLYKFLNQYQICAIYSLPINDSDTIQLLPSKDITLSLHISEVIAWISMKFNNLEDSLNTYQFIHSKNPKFPGVLANIGDILLKQQKLQEAEKFFNEQLELVPNHAPTLSNMFKLKFQMELDSEADTIIDKAMKLHPTYTKFYLDVAIALSSIGASPQAITLLEERNTLYPNDPQIVSQLTSMMWCRHRFDESISLLSQCVSAYPKEQRLHYILCTYYIQQKKVSQSSQIFKKYIQLDRIQDPINKHSILLLIGMAQVIFEDDPKAIFDHLSGLLEAAEGYDDIIDLIINNFVAFIQSQSSSGNLTPLLDLFLCPPGYLAEKIQKIIFDFEKGNQEQRPSVLLKWKLEEFRQVISLIGYSQHIQDYLFFKSSIQNWDLSLD